jgi:hypothetical protein
LIPGALDDVRDRIIAAAREYVGVLTPAGHD